MPKLDADVREALIVATVDVVMESRRLALAMGANPLKLWDQIHSRLRAAARTTDSAEEWSTKFTRDLQLAAPSKDLSLAIRALSETATASLRRAWLDLLDREHGYVVARARLEAERRKDAIYLESATCGAAHPELNRTCHRQAHDPNEDHAVIIDGQHLHWR